MAEESGARKKRARRSGAGDQAGERAGDAGTPRREPGRRRASQVAQPSAATQRPATPRRARRSGGGGAGSAEAQPTQTATVGQSPLPGAASGPETLEQPTPTPALSPQPSLDEGPPPDPWATAWTELDMRCPTCRIVHYAPTCIFLNARESPQLVQQIVSGHFNTKRCPLCRKVEPVDYPFTYFDPDRKLAVQVRSEWEWHAGGGEPWYAARLEDYFEKWAEHDVRIEVVFGQHQLVERFLQDLPSPPARR